jgi:RHS repeat-associated protein
LSGNVFTLAKRDLFLPGLFNLEVLRGYSAQNRARDCGMGWGWSHTLGWNLERRGKLLELYTGDGQKVMLPFPKGNGDDFRDGAWGLLARDGNLVVRPGNEFLHFFSPHEPGSNTYRLDAVAYRDRRHIELHYEGKRLVEILDSVGRRIAVEPTRDGRIASLSATDPEGSGTLVFARYAYDDEGNLIAAADADGHITTYAYDGEHRLTRLENPNGLVFHFVYDRQGRCIETWGAYKDGVDPALAPDVPKVLRDGRRAKGIFHCRLDFGGDYVEVTDSVRVQRYFGAPRGRGTSKGVDARGGVTTRAYDERGRITAREDPNGGVWSYQYDVLDQIAVETDPEGQTTRIERDGAGRPVTIIDPAGGAIRVTHNAEDEVEFIENQKGAITRFSYARGGVLTRRVDPRGGEWTFDYDAHANLVALTHAEHGTDTYTYDYWGRRLTSTDPLGNTQRYTYSPAGNVVRFDDAVGRSIFYEYDSMGNRIREIRPDGASIYEDFAGLNWRWRIRQPDGTEVRVQFNREGWPVRLLNEAGQTWEFEYGPTGLIQSERDFLGRLTRYQYDAVGRAINVATDDGEGIKITRDKIGRVVVEEASDGSTRSYAYNERGELVATRSGDVEVSWSRDATGLIVGEQMNVNGTKYSLSFKRDPAGNRESVQSSLDHAMVLQRDGNGLVRALGVDGARALSIDRDVVGAPVRRTLAGGGAMLSRYDGEYRLTNREVVTPGAGASSSEPQWVGATRGVGRTYEYTPLDEIAVVSSADGASYEYRYDLRRHLQVRRRSGASDERYAVDATGNYAEAGPDGRPRTFGPGGQLLRNGAVELEYDRRGFLLAKSVVAAPGSPPEKTKFEWNAWGLLSAVLLAGGTRLDFDYDALARRVSKRTTSPDGSVRTSNYLWDLASVLQEVSSDGGVRTYLYEDEQEYAPIGHVENGQCFYYLRDLTGYPEEIVDGTGLRVGQLERDTFGRTARSLGPISTPVRFAGQLADPETGLHYNRYRYYDPDAGRYISPDPIGLAGGMNLYAYANPNPIGWIDPMGWENVATVTGFSGPAPSACNQNPLQYNASTFAPNCPTPFAKTPQGSNAGHSEQKFCYDLMNSGQRNGSYGVGYDPKTPGPQLPPCPNCHAAMMRTAAETGSTIQYQWRGADGNTNTVTYSGNNPPNYMNPVDPNNPNAAQTQGASAAYLQNAYSNISLQNNYNWQNQNAGGQQYRTNVGQNYWGCNMGASPQGQAPFAGYREAQTR